MKRILSFAFVILLLPISLYAAKNSQTVILPAAVQVGATQLTAGQCKVTWTGDGSTGQVTLVTDDKKSVTIPAQVVTESHDHPAVLTISVKGVSFLQEIRLNKVKLVFPSVPQSGN